MRVNISLRRGFGVRECCSTEWHPERLLVCLRHILVIRQESVRRLMTYCFGLNAFITGLAPGFMKLDSPEDVVENQRYAWNPRFVLSHSGYSGRFCVRLLTL